MQFGGRIPSLFFSSTGCFGYTTRRWQSPHPRGCSSFVPEVPAARAKPAVQGSRNLASTTGQFGASRSVVQPAWRKHMETVGNLTKLTYLDLSGNQFFGYIAADIDPTNLFPFNVFSLLLNPATVVIGPSSCSLKSRSSLNMSGGAPVERSCHASGLTEY